MVLVISGTNRKGSNSLRIAKYMTGLLNEAGAEADLVDLSQIPMPDGIDHNYSAKNPFSKAIERVNSAEGLLIVCPEYNGSYPGVLKYFIDHWSYPKSFESRPVAFIGAGGRFGGLRPVEHLQQVFGYRNAYIFPQRVFIMNVEQVFKNGGLEGSTFEPLLKLQADGFVKFVKALKSEKLDANSRIVGV